MLKTRCWRVLTKCKPVYDLHLLGILLVIFHSWKRKTQDQDLCELFWELKKREIWQISKGFYPHSKMKLINVSVHTNVKVQFQWLWLTLKVTFPLFLILQKSLQTFFLGTNLRELVRYDFAVDHPQGPPKSTPRTEERIHKEEEIYVNDFRKIIILSIFILWKSINLHLKYSVYKLRTFYFYQFLVTPGIVRTKK